MLMTIALKRADHFSSRSDTFETLNVITDVRFKIVAKLLVWEIFISFPYYTSPIGTPNAKRYCLSRPRCD